MLVLVEKLAPGTYRLFPAGLVERFGLQRRLGGTVTLDARDLDDWDETSRARRLAYVPQAADSYFDFSLRELVEMGRTTHRGVFASPSPHDREVAQAAPDTALPATEEPPTLHAGNSGSVYFLINGQAFGPAAPGAQVIRNVALDTASLRAAYTVADLGRDADLAVAVAQLRTP